MTVKKANKEGDRLAKLEALAERIASELDEASGATVARLAKEYRETVDEIEILKEEEDDDDEIGELLREREADGKSGAVR